MWKIVAILFGAAVFFANPVYACNDDHEVKRCVTKTVGNYTVTNCK